MVQNGKLEGGDHHDTCCPEIARSLREEQHSPLRSLRGRGGVPVGAGALLRQDLGLPRTRRGPANCGGSACGGARLRVCSSHPWPGRSTARLLQRVPPPRARAGSRLGALPTGSSSAARTTRGLTGSTWVSWGLRGSARFPGSTRPITRSCRYASSNGTGGSSRTPAGMPLRSRSTSATSGG
jgi:hypothetical protein